MMDMPKANASPTKEFFVHMITRDITLEDSILDLIDNSVDAGWKSAGSSAITLDNQTDLSKYWISIDVSDDQFSISDNCGGMSLDDAADYAFSFGRKSTQEHEDYSIGVYGIGMKRAVFKLGEEIRIRSTFLDAEGKKTSFAVPIDVSAWLQGDDNEPWDFDIEEDIVQDEKGLKIVIGKLTKSAARSFGDPAFTENLRRIISRDYSLYLLRGLTIYVNEEPVVGMDIELGKSGEFSPVRINYKEPQNGRKISVEILGGMAVPPPDSAEPEERHDGDKSFGWYVACNGRVVLAADKSDVSGWGTDDWPQWHRQYAGFKGIVLFSAQKTEVLPITTTKRSVDLTSSVYRRAQIHMRAVSKEWIAYTNKRKQALTEAKLKEAKVQPVPIHKIDQSKKLGVPTLRLKRVVQPANVHYAVPVKKMKELASAFGNINMPYRDVGLRSFDYAYDDLAGED